MPAAPQPPQAPVVLPYVPMKAAALLVPPPVMPPLPAAPHRPPATPWMGRSNPSAHLVQQQYLATRAEELELSRQPGMQTACNVLMDMLMKKLPPHKKQKISTKELARIYGAIERNLQSADLTINFRCGSWFANENPYDTYTQMYQRAVVGGTMVLKDSGANAADARAVVDNGITFPKSWQQTQGGQAQRGLLPGRQSPDRIQRQMDTGTVQMLTPGNRKDGFLAENKHFNPDTKQVFLGLNYGRRSHGSTTYYGHSHMVAKSSLKPACLYYAQDTFTYGTKESGVIKVAADASAIQFGYYNLGALLYGNGDARLQEDIFKACYEGQILPDPGGLQCAYYMIEAHHFGEFIFRDHVEYMVISPKDVADASLWPMVVANANKFCRRQGIKLYQTA